jgi:hypothetical protein
MESRGHCLGVGVGVQSPRRNWRNKLCVPTREEGHGHLLKCGAEIEESG